MKRQATEKAFNFIFFRQLMRGQGRGDEKKRQKKKKKVKNK